jgi:hypothetical protein
MAGLGLIHLGFLAAAAAVAVPILIHLLLRPRARRLEIGSVRFLQRVLRESTRRRKVRRWLLLALRVASVLLLALLFARPYLSGMGSEGRDREVLLLIDQSASMSVVQGGQALFAAAQKAAQKVIEEQPEGTIIHVAYFDAHGVEPMTEARIDPERQAGYAATDYPLALRWARDQLMLSGRRQRQLFLLTDLQRSGLRGSGAEDLIELPCRVMEMGKQPTGNLSIVSAETAQTVSRPGESIVVIAQASNGGPFPARNVRLRLQLKGPEPAEQVQTVTLDGASVQEVRFRLEGRKAGLYTGFVEIAGSDDFPLDNRRWLAFEVRPSDSVLLVDGEPGRTVFANETYYLEAALRLRLPGKGPSLTPYEPVRLAWSEGAALDELRRHRVVVLCNVAALSESSIRKLKDFVKAGGGLLVFTGGRVEPDRYQPLQQAGLLPAAMEGTVGPDVFPFAGWDRDHPIFRPLSDPQQGDLRRIVFHHVSRLRPLPGARVLATTRSGAPLLVESKHGQGTILLAGISADRDWGPWPQSRLYVPLIHQMVGYLSERLPENQRVRLEPTGPGRDNPPGIVPLGRMAVVHNLDPAESEIERVLVAQFRARLHLGDPDEPGKGKQAEAGRQQGPGALRPDELWKYVVWVLLVVLAIELVVASRGPA